MTIFSSLWKLIKTIIKKIVKWVVNFIKKYWLIMAVLAVIWFAPAIATWLSSVGAPSFLTSAFSWVGTSITPYLTAAGGYLWTGLTSVVGGGWDAFASASIGTKAAILGGLAFALAPEETAQLITDTATGLADLAGGVVGAIAGGIVSSPIGMALLVGLGVWLLWPASKEDRAEEIARLRDEVETRHLKSELSGGTA